MKLAIILGLALAGVGPAVAEDQACLTSINGEKRALVYDPDEPNVKANIGLREKTFGGPDGIECPGFVTLSAILRQMDGTITYAQMAPFCLQYDRDQSTYLGIAVGSRNAFLHCRARSRSLCQYVNGTKDAALAVAGFGSSVAEGTNAAARAQGVSAVTGGAGALILSGPAAYLSGLFGSLGASALAALTAPATVTATAVTVVVVGSAVYACGE